MIFVSTFQSCLCNVDANDKTKIKVIISAACTKSLLLIQKMLQLAFYLLARVYFLMTG